MILYDGQNIYLNMASFPRDPFATLRVKHQRLSFSNIRPHRLTVRTRPSQGCNRGSIPRGANKNNQLKADCFY